MSSGRTPSLNLRLHGYEECADFVARTISKTRTNYSVHVSDVGSMHVTRHNRGRKNELPAGWFVGNYPYSGMRVEYIEDDLLERMREIQEVTQ